MQVPVFVVGACFQFNSNGTMTTGTEGINGGLFVALNVSVDDYSAFGTSSYATGFIVR